MNWLAHIFLSPDDAEYRIGNVVADWVKGEARLQLSAGVQRGIACHKVIDLYTDAHPITKQSVARIEAPFKRYAGVLIDVFYDHILAQDWRCYCDMPLHEWSRGVYAQFKSQSRDLHPDLRRGLLRMAEDDWLGSYATIEGIDEVLKRMSHRLSRPNLLGEAAPQLTAHLAGIRDDFHIFFPQLQAHVRDWQAAQPEPPKAFGAL